MSSTLLNVGTARESWLALSIFVLLAGLAVLGFAPSYLNATTFTGKTFTTLVHLHGLLMVLWLTMLVAQPWFVATRRTVLHRYVGRASLIIVPLAIAVILATAHEQLGREAEINADVARLQVLAWGQAIGFGGSWALALAYRRRSNIHMRLMVSTAFAIGGAAVTRALINWVPGFQATDPALAATAAVLLIPLALLIFLDQRAGIRYSPFWFVTIVIAFMYLGVWSWGTSDEWVGFVRSFAGSA